MLPIILRDALDFEHYITIGGVIAPTVTIIVGTLLAWVLKRIDDRGKRIEDNAKLAADRSEPTGNGFAAGTTAALARLEAALSDVRRDVGGVRSDYRTLTRRVDHIGTRLDDHIDRKD